jgi:hypothetical protein
MPFCSPTAWSFTKCVSSDRGNVCSRTLTGAAAAAADVAAVLSLLLVPVAGAAIRCCSTSAATCAVQQTAQRFSTFRTEPIRHLRHKKCSTADACLVLH